MVPEGIVPEMVLIHYDDTHYNLVISRDSNLAQMGTISQQKQENGQEDEKKREEISQTDEKLDMSFDDDTNEDVNMQKQLEEITCKYRQSEVVIANLNKRISDFEKQLKNRSNVKDDNDEEMFDGAAIKKNKENGFRRECPQSQSKQKSNETKFKCKVCKEDLKSQSILDEHLKVHEENDLKYPCEKCMNKFKRKNQLDKHNEKEHSQFNCNDCSYQGDCEKNLKKHLNLTHHNSSQANAESDKQLTCRSCGIGFDAKWELMRHRKMDHPEIIRKCKYFLRGMCDFESEICW